MSRRFRSSAGAAALLLLLLVALVCFSADPGDPAIYPGDAVEILVVSNGFHSGLVLPIQALRAAASRDGDAVLEAVATRFSAYPFVEVGWGDARFYRAVPDTASFDWWLAARALFAPGNAAVMHVEGVAGHPEEVFARTDVVRLRLGEEGFARLTGGLDRSFARDASGLPDDLGPGLGGPSRFYAATGTFSALNLCNHWTARMLSLAGVPTSWAVALVPAGLTWDLRRRALAPGSAP